MPSIKSLSSSESRNTALDPFLEGQGKRHKWSKDECELGLSECPKTLRDSSPSFVMRLLPHVATLLIPIALIVLGIMVRRLDNQDESDRGNAVIQATKVASTLWPIAFAAVVGSTSRAMALYKAERGIRLGTLELLTTSQTLVATIRGFVMLRICSKWTILLIAIWTLSPIGGQAVLRSVELKTHTVNQTWPLMYFPSNDLWMNTVSSSLNGASSGASIKGKLRQTITAAISSPDAGLFFADETKPEFALALERLGGELQAIESTQRDLWGNVRIPMLHLLPGYNASNKHQWIEVPKDRVAPYSSLIGEPIRGIPESSVGNMTLQVSTVYHYLTCSPWFNGTSWLRANPGKLTFHSTNATTMFSQFNSLNSANANLFVDVLKQTYPWNLTRDGIPSTPVEPAVLVCGARAFPGINMTACTTTAHYVDTTIHCTRLSPTSPLSCAATHMRSTPHLPPSNWTALNLAPPAYLQNLLQTIPAIALSDHTSEPSTLETFLLDPPTSLSPSLPYPRPYPAVPLPLFQARLSLVLNSFHLAATNISNIFAPAGLAPSPQTVRSYANATGAWTSLLPPRYTLHPRWLALYAVATGVVAICAVSTVVLRACIRAPDLLGTVSGLTRDSVYVRGGLVGGSGRPEEWRARRLRGLGVRIRDVRPTDAVGRIAFGDWDGGWDGSGLVWERVYE